MVNSILMLMKRHNIQVESVSMTKRILSDHMEDSMVYYIHKESWNEATQSAFVYAVTMFLKNRLDPNSGDFNVYAVVALSGSLDYLTIKYTYPHATDLVTPEYIPNQVIKSPKKSPTSHKGK